MTTSALAVGIAGLIGAAGLGVYDPATVHAAGTVAITLHYVPPTPDDLITITPYLTSDDPFLNDSTIGFQVLTRALGDPTTVLDRDDAVFAVLQGLRDLTINSVPVVQVRRVSSVTLGQDDNQRWMRTSNYYADVAWPTPNRTD